LLFQGSLNGALGRVAVVTVGVAGVGSASVVSVAFFAGAQHGSSGSAFRVVAAWTKGVVMTMITTEMLDSYPADLGGIDRQKLAECIQECYSCAQACTACADACLSEGDVAGLVKCIRSNLDCADICFATGQVLSRHTGYDANLTRAILEACATACKACGDICAEHAGHMAHCEHCARECRKCEAACRELIGALG